MTQQINLYLPEFRKEKDLLSFANMVAAVIALVIILALVSGARYYGSYQLGQAIAEKQRLLQEARERTNELADSFGSQNEDSQLANEVRQLEENLQGKRTLLNFLDGRDIGNVDGFSEYLADLSRFHIDGLRLTRINLRGGGQNVFLSGEVARAENVPLYLQNLRNGASYNGKNFETLRISSSDSADNLNISMRFDVATTGAMPREGQR